MIQSCYDKIYHTFKEGDEVYTEKTTWKAISAHKPYIVLKCYKPQGYIKSYPVIMIELMSDGGYLSRYATDRFLKTEAQLRQDKVELLLSECDS
jgi:hypothetical protein